MRTLSVPASFARRPSTGRFAMTSPHQSSARTTTLIGRGSERKNRTASGSSCTRCSLASTRSRFRLIPALYASYVRPLSKRALSKVISASRADARTFEEHAQRVRCSHQRRQLADGTDHDIRPRAVEGVVSVLALQDVHRADSLAPTALDTREDLGLVIDRDVAVRGKKPGDVVEVLVLVREDEDVSADGRRDPRPGHLQG